MSSSVYRPDFYKLVKQGRLSIVNHDNGLVEASLRNVFADVGGGLIQLVGRGKARPSAMKHLADQYCTAQDLRVLSVV